MLQQISCYLILCFYIQTVYTSCGPTDDPSVPSQIKFIVYKGNGVCNTTTEATLDKPCAVRKAIDREKATVIFIPGFQSSPKVLHNLHLLNAFLARGTFNVICLDWTKISSDPIYSTVGKYVPSVGTTVGHAILRLSDVININLLHLIGHSLGAHVAGYAGRVLKQYEKPLKRISILDPAGPLFYPSECHISPMDAEFVDALHTNPGALGTDQRTATADFWANKGALTQPGCPTLIIPIPTPTTVTCSHSRAVDLFASSVLNPYIYPSYPSYPSDPSGPSHSEHPTDPEVTFYGYYIPTNTRGEWYFNTTGEYPFGLGSPSPSSAASSGFD